MHETSNSPVRNACSATRGMPTRRRLTWPDAGLFLLIPLLLISPAAAQSATNFNSRKPAPVSPPVKIEKPATPKPKEAATVITIPSRFVGPAELDAYVTSLTSAFSMHDRATDPFGQLQDPNAKPVVKATVAKTTQRAPQLQATPFSDIVRLIIVTTIMPGEKRFLVGTRSFAQGDHIPLTFRNKQIRVEVIQVTSQQIVFRNLDTGETASRKLDMLPAGMTPGHRGINAPGMVPDRPNAPIELDGGEPQIQTSQNR